MNAKTGLWSAVGALLGGVVGATAGRYAAVSRPRYRYAEAPPPEKPERPRRGSPVGSEVEDAMVVGGAAGAMLGAFIAGSASSEDVQAPYPPPQIPR